MIRRVSETAAKSSKRDIKIFFNGAIRNLLQSMRPHHILSQNCLQTHAAHKIRNYQAPVFEAEKTRLMKKVLFDTFTIREYWIEEDSDLSLN